MPVPKHRVMSQVLSGQADSMHCICPCGYNTGERFATDFTRGWSWFSGLDKHSGRGRGALVWPRVPSRPEALRNASGPSPRCHFSEQASHPSQMLWRQLAAHMALTPCFQLLQLIKRSYGTFNPFLMSLFP